ncbi:hypothetical protein C8T65DRAFT_699468 [Cerioporus squamosus]|nr:hypothetical protein C8T65DRAFT_699468 [Cerioporus squamosus]
MTHRDEAGCVAGNCASSEDPSPFSNALFFFFDAAVRDGPADFGVAPCADTAIFALSTDAEDSAGDPFSLTFILRVDLRCLGAGVCGNGSPAFSSLGDRLLAGNASVCASCAVVGSEFCDADDVRIDWLSARSSETSGKLVSPLVSLAKSESASEAESGSGRTAMETWLGALSASSSSMFTASSVAVAVDPTRVRESWRAPARRVACVTRLSHVMGHHRQASAPSALVWCRPQKAWSLLVLLRTVLFVFPPALTSHIPMLVKTEPKVEPSLSGEPLPLTSQVALQGIRPNKTDGPDSEGVKKPKTEDGAAVPSTAAVPSADANPELLNGNKRCAEFWYPDGNVVILVQDTAFKLYKARLSKYSIVFAGRFGEDSGEGRPTMEGCPVYEMEGLNVDDFRQFLEALETPFVFSSNPPSQETSVSILRASQVLHCATTRAFAIDKLRSIWPDDKPKLPGGRMPWEDAVRIIQVSRECGVPELRKRAFYEIVRGGAFWQTQLQNRAAIQLPDADIVAFLTARQVVFEPPCGKNAMCSTKLCAVKLQKVGPVARTGLWRAQMIEGGDFDAGRADPIGHLEVMLTKRSAELEAEGWCGSCMENRKKLWAEAQEKWWSMLDRAQRYLHWRVKLSIVYHGGSDEKPKMQAPAGATWVSVPPNASGKLDIAHSSSTVHPHPLKPVVPGPSKLPKWPEGRWIGRLSSGCTPTPSRINALTPVPPQASAELAATYAALILADDGIEITADKITALTNAASVELEPIWASLLAKALEGKNVKELLSNVGAGGAGPAAAAPGTEEEEKKEEEKEESDDDMGFGLFD